MTIEVKKSKGQVKIEKLIAEFNKTSKSKVLNDPEAIFHIGAILTRLDILPVPGLVEFKKEYRQYQNDLHKISKIGSLSAITELKFITTKGKSVRLTSKRLIKFIIEGLNMKDAKEDVGGRHQDPLIEASRSHIIALRTLKVPFKFISDLFGIEDADTLRRAANRWRTKPPSKS